VVGHGNLQHSRRPRDVAHLGYSLPFEVSLESLDGGWSPIPVRGTEHGPAVMPVALGCLPHHPWLLFSHFGAATMYKFTYVFSRHVMYIFTHTHIYKDIQKFVPLHPCSSTSPTTMSRGSRAQFRHATPPWRGPPTINHHDCIFRWEGHRVASARVLVEFCTLSRGP
jgi:hypothetical protein